MTGNIPLFKIDLLKLQLPENLTGPSHGPLKTIRFQELKYFFKLLQFNKLKLPRSNKILQGRYFGWIVAGSTQKNQSLPNNILL